MAQSSFKIEGKTAIGHFLTYRPLIHELVTRDLKVKYRRSFLGYVWSVLNPLMMMCLQAWVFTVIFQSNIENYPLYLIIGNTLYTFFAESTTISMNSIISNAGLIKKVYIPKFILPISSVVSSLVTTLFSFAAIVIVMIITRAPVHWTIVLVWFPLLSMFLFNCGVGMILAGLTVYFRDMQHLYGVVTLALMYATPIFYSIDAMTPEVQFMIRLNPIYHYINLFRCLIMIGGLPGPNTWFACIASAIVTMVIGLMVFRKLQKDFLLHI